MQPYWTKPACLLANVIGWPRMERPAVRTEGRTWEKMRSASQAADSAPQSASGDRTAATQALDVIIVDRRCQAESRRVDTVDRPRLKTLNEEVMNTPEQLHLARGVTMCVRTNSCLFLSDWKSCKRASGQLNALEAVQLRLEAA